jgi:adenosylcobinamide kinase/adenosylcobinamide-phosphate guanylyltransferase
MLTLILGGARSGKSHLAERLAANAGRVSYVATARNTGDAEMAARIETHRARRPASWRTIEEPIALADAVERAAPEADTIVVDCLTIWLSNLFWELRECPDTHLDDTVRSELRRIKAASHPCHTFLVSNELGCGTVPEHAMTRAFRDTQGQLNQWAAEAADQVILSVAGLPLYLKQPALEEAR